MKKLLLLFIGLIVYHYSPAQLLNFYQTKGSSMNDAYYGGITLSNGDVFLVANSNSTSNDFGLRLSSQGDTIWCRSFQSNLYTAFNGFTEAADGSIYIVGRVNGGSSGIGVSKFDGLGNLIWDNFYGYIAPTHNYVEPPLCVAEGNDLIYAFGGTQNMKDSLCIGRISSGGTVLFSKRIDISAFTDGGTASSNTVFGLKKAANGNNIAAIQTLYGTASTFYLTLLEFDNNGNIIWFKSYESFNDASGFFSNYTGAMDVAANGEIVITGKVDIGTSVNTSVIKFDNSGSVIWATNLITEASDAKIKVLSNGEIAVLVKQTYVVPDGNPKHALILLDANGTIQWTRTFGTTSLYDICSVHEDPSGRILAFSSSVGYGGWSNELQIVNAEVDGTMIGCFDVIDNLTQSNQSLTEFTGGSMPIVNKVITQSPMTVTTTPLYGIYTPLEPTLTTSGNVTHPLCNGEVGSIIYNVSNGTNPYEFSWSNGTNNQNLVNAPDGSYVVRVSDGKGCIELDTFDITEPTELTASFTSSNVDCFGAQNGSIDVTPSGGTTPYDYSWSNTATTQDLSGLGGGFYQLTITDDNGCEKQLGISVNEPQQLIAAIQSTQNVLCNGDCTGEIVSFGAGGVAPYSYQWNDPGSQNTATASNLCTGNYLLTVTDNNNCNAYANVTIAEPAELSNSTTIYNSDCFATNGSAVANVTGGTSPYQYNWDGSGLGASDSIGDLDVGSYILGIEDANGCTWSESFSINSNTNPVEICVISVNDQNQNVIVWEKPVAANIAGFNIYRNIGGAYTQIGFRPYDSLSIYTDTEFGVDPTITSYRYKISVLDSCGGESILSDFHETIHLTSSVGLSGEVNLVWDNYEGFGYTQYEIWRDTTNQGNWELINSVPSTNFTYVDVNVPSNLSLVRYAIDVAMPSTCTATGKAQDYNSSRSNTTSSILSDDQPTGIEEYELDARIFPNPASEEFNLIVNASDYQYEIIDLAGRKVIPLSPSVNNQTKIDVSGFEDGIYFVNIEWNGSVITKKLIKQ